MTLHGQSPDHWNEPELVVRAVMGPRAPGPQSKQEALLVGQNGPVAGYRGYFYPPNAEPTAPRPKGAFTMRLPMDMAPLEEGDVLRVVPRVGEVSLLYRRHSPHNTVFLTERCNAACRMCPQPPRRTDTCDWTALWLQAIPLMDRQTGALGITGGEPTLVAKGLLDVLRACREHLPETALHLLSNGRMFNYVRLCQEIARLDLHDLIVGVPLYGDTADRHDALVRAPGAFDQTVRGVMNLARCGARVELRLVLCRPTLERLPAMARFIVVNLPFVSHVAFMGLELVGWAQRNAPELWVEPREYGETLTRAVALLDESGVPVSIYNLPLCLVPRPLWPFARQSITDWKVRYAPACAECAVRPVCGGVFYSVQERLTLRPLAEPLATAKEAVS